MAPRRRNRWRRNALCQSCKYRSMTSAHFGRERLGKTRQLASPLRATVTDLNRSNVGGERYVLGDAVVFFLRQFLEVKNASDSLTLSGVQREGADTDQRRAASDAAGSDGKESLDGDESDVDNFLSNESRLNEAHDVFVDVRWLQTAAQLGVADLVITKMKGAGVTMSKARRRAWLVGFPRTRRFRQTRTRKSVWVCRYASGVRFVHGACVSDASKRPASLYFCNARESMPMLPEATTTMPSVLCIVLGRTKCRARCNS